MMDPLSRDDEQQGYPGARAFFWIALGAIAIYLCRAGRGVTSREWGYLLLGVVLLSFTAIGVKTGWTSFSYRRVRRSDEPGFYWTSIALSGASGLAAVTFSAGALLGYWGM